MNRGAGWVVPAGMVERAERFAASGEVPPEPRVAATVVLLRPADGHFEAYAIRRAATMAFGGVYAFPGGGVDPWDAGSGGVGRAGWAGPSPRWWGEKLRLPVSPARAVVCAAARELFEEAGVLLAGTGPGDLVRDAGAPRWERARVDLAARRLSLTGFLDREGLCLRADLLLPWSRWITPDFEPRRFDTYFFIAVMPEGQLARDVSGEADHAMWFPVRQAVQRCEAGELPMLPPTLQTLRELAQYDDADGVRAAVAARDPGAPVRPRLVRTPTGTHHLTVDPADR